MHFLFVMVCDLYFSCHLGGDYFLASFPAETRWALEPSALCEFDGCEDIFSEMIGLAEFKK